MAVVRLSLCLSSVMAVRAEDFVGDRLAVGVGGEQDGDGEPVDGAWPAAGVGMDDADGVVTARSARRYKALPTFTPTWSLYSNAQFRPYTAELRGSPATDLILNVSQGPTEHLVRLLWTVDQPTKINVHIGGYRVPSQEQPQLQSVA